MATGVLSMLAAASHARQQDEIVVFEPQQEAIIHYLDSSDLSDPGSKLKAKVESGELKLDYEPGRGYLKSILKQLHVPESSQCLVFSKTSGQVEFISPKTPRALYFTDNAYVAWMQGSPRLEIAALDPKKGTIFYAVDQKPGGKPRFERRLECMRCHFGAKTLGAPGLLVGSAFTKSDGVATSQVYEFVSGHNSPLNMRWGGWYVTGTCENDVHLGNSFLTDIYHPEKFDPKPGTNVTDLSDRFDVSKYLAPTSDIVALMVLDDAVRMHDMIIHAGLEARFAADDRKRGGSAPGWPEKRIANAAEPLLAYMLFRDESHLKGRLQGSPDFVRDFERGGPRDHLGRSLRELDLNKRLFKYPCSYLIYTNEFDALPKEMKEFIWKRLAEILTGRDQSPLYRKMEADDRKAVLDILLDTKRDFRAWCSANHAIG